MLLKQSLLGIVVFYTQKTPKRGEHSWDQGIVSLEAIFSIYGSEFDDLFLQGTVVVNGQEVEIKKAAEKEPVDKEKVNTYFFL